eukprot:CAMPEP_0173172456 /NCGR_PEP_ID=MMETSP1141-20130122/2319_1 /TAXON_ID=483371 /ORGANISM="non described non described, Strain CCMP2298" /LENGTH=295 /DNA_ID=CAMNT_0014094495 /DNA_START=1215 /DNA_END=2105 /DNA_ORIENTATION=+
MSLAPDVALRVMTVEYPEFESTVGYTMLELDGSALLRVDVVQDAVGDCGRRLPPIEDATNCEGKLLVRVVWHRSERLKFVHNADEILPGQLALLPHAALSAGALEHVGVAHLIDAQHHGAEALEEDSVEVYRPAHVLGFGVAYERLDDAHINSHVENMNAGDAHCSAGAQGEQQRRRLTLPASEGLSGLLGEIGRSESEEETEQGQSDYLQPQLVNGLHALRQKIAIEPDAGLFRVADGGNYEGWWYADAQLGNLAQLRSLYSQSCWKYRRCLAGDGHLYIFSRGTFFAAILLEV